MTFNPEQHPHRRYNPLTNEWVLVSPHRTQRPWQGQREKASTESAPAYDPQCYLCPGNERAGGAVNPKYGGTFVFRNDFSALMPDTPIQADPGDPHFRSDGVQGECRVVCFSPRHDLTLPEMEVPDIRRVVDIWAEQVLELGERYRWVQLFENKGSPMGASNPHPHGQVWASSFLPRIPAAENEAQREFLDREGRNLLVSYAEREIEMGVRVVELSVHWVMLVPFWAVWPFEYLLLPRRHVLRLPNLSGDERDDLAVILKRSLIRYDNLFETSFPYSMGWHGAPTGPDPTDDSHWQLHAHFFPPLLRSATVKKFMVGYEMLGEPQRDITAEQAAARLRDLPDVHYKSSLK